MKFAPSTIVSFCPVCSAGIGSKRCFCRRKCYGKTYKLGLVDNLGNFTRGSESLNKGRTLESWVGEERLGKSRPKCLSTLATRLPNSGS